MAEPLPLDDPQLRPFLPLLYVGWADGELAPAEVRALREKVLAMPWLDAAARASLARWLDPDAPPSSEDLTRVLETVRRTAGTLRERRRRTLVELGLELLEQVRAGGAVGEASDARDALEEVAQALGLDGATEPSEGLLRSRSAADERPGPRASFDPAVLRARLDRDAPEVRDRVRAFLSDPTRRVDGELSSDVYRARVFDWLRALADEGVGALGYPGVTTDAADAEGFLVAFETLGLGDLSLLVKFGVQFGLFGGSIYFLGSEAQRASLLPGVASVELPGCFAMSELGHGSNVAAIETTAAFDAATDELVVHTPNEGARKEWIGNAAAHGRLATVFAQLEVGGEPRGVHAVLVPIRDADGAPCPGVRIGDGGHKMGLNGVDNGRLWFDRVRVPRTALLSRFAQITPEGRYESPIASPARRFFTMLGTLVAGRVSIGAAAVSASKVGLAIALRYAASRRQFGPPGRPETPILDYPTHRRRLLPALAATYALHFAAEAVRRRYLERVEDDAREVEALAAAFKAIATRHATDTLQTCRETCGGQGYLTVNRIASLKSDTDVFTTFEGDNVVLLQLVAKSLLTGYRKQFEEERLLGVVRHVVRRGLAEVREKNPRTTRRTDPEHLRDAGTLAASLAAREASLLDSAAARIRRRIADGTEPDAAAREVQEHLVALARAHAERVVFDAFRAAVEAQPAGPVRAVLERLLALHGLSRLEADAAWFLERGYLEGAKARAIRKEVEALCEALAPEALGLVEAFGIPELALAAPIAFADPAAPAH